MIIRSNFFELSQWFNLEHALQTNGVTKSDATEVTKKLLKNASKRKGGEKNTNDGNNVININNVD